MAPNRDKHAGPLIAYTEPFNTRILREADELNDEALSRFRKLRKRHELLAVGLIMLFVELPGAADRLQLPRLALRGRLPRDLDGTLPDAVLDATELRPLMEALEHAWAEATAEFDELFASARGHGRDA